jgi:hypothetical protein
MPELITPTEAATRGLRPLTTTYSPSEQWMVENVVADMKRGNIDHALVTVEVYGDYSAKTQTRPILQRTEVWRGGTNGYKERMREVYKGH